MLMNNNSQANFPYNAYMKLGGIDATLLCVSVLAVCKAHRLYHNKGSYQQKKKDGVFRFRITVKHPYVA